MPFAPAFCQMQKKKKGTENVLFSFPFIMKQKEHIPSLLSEKKKEKATCFPSPLFWRTDKKKKKGERHLSFFILSLPQMEWRISLLPEKRKEKKTRRWKNAGRRKKDKNGKKEKGERSERTKAGETATRHATERHIPDAGEQEKNRKRISRQEAGNGSENAIFRLMIGMTAGRRIFLHFRFPFALVNTGKVVNHISPFFSPSPSWHERLLPPLPSPSFFVSQFSFVVYFNTIIWYHCIVLKEEKRRKKKC